MSTTDKETTPSTEQEQEQEQEQKQEQEQEQGSTESKGVSSKELFADNRPEKATEAVLVQSVAMPDDHPTVFGYDFNQGVDYEQIMKHYISTGFQSTHLGKAMDRVNDMIKWRLSDEEVTDRDSIVDPDLRKKTRATIFLGYTSNMISSGLREVIRYLVEHKMVDAIVTTGGGIEEDFMKCMTPHYHGAFNLNGKDMRLKGLNRLGNLIVPNDNYVKFEEFMMPILNAMLKEQQEDGVVWSPSKIIDRLGKEIDNEDSVYYWAHKNNIPVFCPAITDGSIGDMIYFQSYQNEGLVVDIAQDIRRINDIAVKAAHSGMIILGGGIVKHHICNANLMRNGADWAVYINTAHEFDGSDSGAAPSEAVTWGKISIYAEPVKVCAEATLVFPLLVAETFAKNWEPKEDVYPRKESSSSSSNSSDELQ